MKAAKQFLVLNTGSSTIKYAIFAGDDLTCLERGKREITADTFTDILEGVLQHAGKVNAVGHRIVHGGQKFIQPLIINDQILQQIEDLVPLAPLHLPHNLHAIREIRDKHMGLRQVACFDTAFHATQGKLHRLYALPKSITQDNVLRYGFHGLSYEYIARVLPQYTGKANGKIIVLHLGSGASACAIHELKSVTSTMGFTAVEGLMMSTRCGSLDPGLVLYLLQEKKLSYGQVENLLYKQSGLLGVSGISGDVNDLVDSEDVSANEALDLFCLYAVRAIGCLSAELQGLDALVFTAGIGENQPLIREKICEQLAWLGVCIDEQANRGNVLKIHDSNKSNIEVLVIPTNEEEVIASHMRALL